jgi:hypothetical protein
MLTIVLYWFETFSHHKGIHRFKMFWEQGAKEIAWTFDKENGKETIT